MNKPVLVVMAAGMGSRFGGLKQMEPIDDNGHVILDYTVYDAHRAGFDTVIFVIKPEIEKDFREKVGDRIAKVMDVKYVFQRADDLPAGYTVPEGRTKPWGTAQAVLAARDVIDGPFAVINADDCYGPEGFEEIYNYLLHHPDTPELYEYAMVGYLLKNTLTENGTVARGVCTETASGYLHSVVERTKIMQGDRCPMYTEDEGKSWHDLCEDDIVSMNLWGFQKSYLEEAWAGFPAFLVKNGGLNSGFMIVQYSAAALVSENKVLAHPASVDSIPSSAGQEDHVSMGTIAARKAAEILANVRRVLAMEIMCSCQAIDLAGNADKLGKGTKPAYDTIRKVCAMLEDDRPLFEDINNCESVLIDHSFVNAVEAAAGAINM